MRVLAFLFFSSMFFVACDSATKNSKNWDFHQYIILTKLKDGETSRFDTTTTLERSDSAAFLRGTQEFGRYITELDFGHLGNWVPVSFTVLNENFQDIRASLNPSTLQIIDSIAKIKIAKERNNIYDSLGNIRIYDSTRKGLRNLLDSLMKFPRPNPEKEHFLTADSFEENKNQRMQMALKIIEQLRTFNITSDKYLKLEYFFYTNKDEKAKLLAEEIKKLNYSVKHEQAAGNKSLFIVTGWTTKIKMEDSIVSNWVKEMCELGYKFDCLFDGWGTDPNQQ